MSNIINLKDKITGEIVLYQPDDTIRLEVKIEDETVWLTQAQMAELFQTTIPNVNLHLKNIYEECELEEFATIKDFLIVRQEGKRRVQRNISFYNLDAIISVGYRITSRAATLFRRWATQVLKEYMINGIVINQRIDRLGHKVVEHDQKFDLLLKMSQQQSDLLQNEIRNLKYYIESILADFNDINEDTRMQLELINQMIAELQAKNNWIDKPRNPIGFVKSKS